METKLLNLAVSRLSDELEKLKAEVVELKSQIAILKANKVVNQITPTINHVEQQLDNNVLLDTKEVLSILGVSFNTLTKLVQQGIIKRVQITKKRIRFTKNSITNFIVAKSS